MKRFFVFLNVFVLVLSAFCIFSFADSFSYDDRSDYISYTSATRVYAPSAYCTTLSRISYGNNASFKIYGTSLNIYSCSYSNSSSALVYVDGVSFLFFVCQFFFHVF